MLNSDRIRCAVIGLGRSGVDHHLKVLSEMPERYEVIGIFDPDQDHARAVAERYRTRSYPAFSPLVSERAVDVVVIASPSHLHAGQSLLAMAEGKGVICEKPMTTNLPDAQKMRDFAGLQNTVCSVFHNSRYAGDFLKVREIIASGCLGRLVEIRMCLNNFTRRRDWQGFSKYGGGVLLNTGPHPIDQALQLIPAGEFALSSHKGHIFSSGGGDDHARILIQSLAGGPLIDMELSNADAFGAPRWHIIGSRGGLTGSGLHFRWKFARSVDSEKADPEPVHYRDLQPERIAWEEHEWKASEDIRANGYYEAFYESFTKHRKPCIDLSDAVLVMEVIDAVNSAPSLRTKVLNRRVRVDPPPFSSNVALETASL